MKPTFSSLLVAPPSQSKAALHTLETDGKLEGLEGLPIEIIFDIFQQLDVRGIFSLGQVTTLFHGLLKTNRAAILLPVLQREFSPFPELLQVYTVSGQDLSRYGDTFQPRKVVFRRFPGDIAGVTLSRGGFQTDSTLSPEQVLFSKIIDSGKLGSADALPAPRAATLVDGDLDSLLKYCMVVRRWEELYPRLRWFSAPEDCRHLEETEKFKLRRALYRWWLYASYFHGELPRPPGGQPLPFVNDIRMSHTRLHPTRELMEMKDLFTCVKQLIRHYIYPILEQKLGPVSHPETSNSD